MGEGVLLAWLGSSVTRPLETGLYDFDGGGYGLMGGGGTKPEIRIVIFIIHYERERHFTMLLKTMGLTFLLNKTKPPTFPVYSL